MVHPETAPLRWLLRMMLLLRLWHLWRLWPMPWCTRKLRLYCAVEDLDEDLATCAFHLPHNVQQMAALLVSCLRAQPELWRGAPKAISTSPCLGTPRSGR